MKTTAQNPIESRVEEKRRIRTSQSCNVWFFKLSSFQSTLLTELLGHLVTQTLFLYIYIYISCGFISVRLKTQTKRVNIAKKKIWPLSIDLPARRLKELLEIKGDFLYQTGSRFLCRKSTRKLDPRTRRSFWWRPSQTTWDWWKKKQVDRLNPKSRALNEYTWLPTESNQVSCLKDSADSLTELKSNSVALSRKNL